MSITIYEIRSIEPHLSHRDCSVGVKIEFSIAKDSSVNLSVLGDIIQSKCSMYMEITELKITMRQKWLLSVIKNESEGYNVEILHLGNIRPIKHIKHIEYNITL